MEEPSTSENVESPQGEQSREKLVQKCKNLLVIAQKAKTARDEALEERGKLQKEIDDARNALKTRDQQFKNVEEIMRVLTEQKLKLAMDIDTLKKEKTTFTNQIRALNDEKETFETEAKSFKRQYNRLLVENEDLIGELQIRKRSESQLLNDIKKLHENNESVKILCTNVTQEKLHLEQELEKLSRRLEAMTTERESFDQALSPRVGVKHVDVKTLLSFIDRISEKSPEIRISEQTNITEDTSSSSLLAATQKENDSLQQEVGMLKDKIQKLMSDLETANVDRDQMMSNLEDVRVETKTLIENVEKLNEEVDVVKDEKSKSEGVLNKVIESKNEEINNFLKELSENKAYISELLSNMEMHLENSNKYTEMNVAFVEKSEELLRCKDEIKVLKKTLVMPSEIQTATDSGDSSNIDCNVLLILKEGIVSNLTDLADTMPEYSKEFLNKLNAILEGADCKEGVGADIFVHYFNECLSQLKISLKENEILSKEVSHLNNSVKELENLVATHNKDCEQLRSELEELSADSNRLLHDLGNLRHENNLRVSEVGELMVRLKQKDEEVDQLKENKNHLEFELHEQIVDLSSKLTDSNNNVIQLQEQNKELELKCQTLISDAQSEAHKDILAVRQQLDTTNISLTALQCDLENSNKALQEQKILLEDLESSKVDMERLIHENELLKKQLSESNEVLEKQTKELEDVLKLLAEASPLKVELEKSKEDLKNCQSKLENAEGYIKEMDNLKPRLEELGEAFQAKSLELEKAQEYLSENSTLSEELEKLKGALTKKIDELKNAERAGSTSLKERDSLIDELGETLKKCKEDLAKKSELYKSCCEQLGKMETLKAENHKINQDSQLLNEQQSQLAAEKKRLLEDLTVSREDVQAVKEELDAAKKELHEMEKSLNTSKIELRNARMVVEEKASIEEELSQVKDIQQKTMEELENTKKLLNENHSVRKQMQEVEKTLRTKIAELEKACKVLEEKSAVSEELENLKKEITVKDEDLERLRTVVSENECMRKNIQELEAALKLKSDELESSRQLLLDKGELEKELSLKSSLGKEAESLKIRIGELEKMVVEKETELTDAVRRLEEGDAVKRDMTKERDNLVAKVAEMEKGMCALGDSQSQASTLREEIALLQKAIDDQKRVAGTETEEKKKIFAEMKQLCEKVQCLQVENNTLQEKLTDQGRAMSEELKRKREEARKLQNEVEELKEMVNFNKMELEDINCIWAGRLNSLKVNLISLGRSINELGRQSAELQCMFLNKICSLQNVITDKAETVVELSVAEAKKELVDEMHRMNEVLKDRGEAIAKLQDSLAQTEDTAESLSKQNVELCEEQTKLKSLLKTKEEKLLSNEVLVKELETEVGRLRELKESAHGESDILSTSTISRTEDQMRLKEVDDSIEEKYLKLRHVAVRLKKRESELTQALEQEKNKSADKTEILEKMQQLSSAAKNAQKVQESYDKTLDELEETKKQNLAMASSLKEMKGTIEGLKKQVAFLESSNGNIPVMHKQIESLNFTIKELKNELNKLEMEKKVEVMKYEESKKQCATLESKIESLSQSLDQAVQQGRSNNVLELEMKNYEKVIADLTAQLNSEKQKLSNADNECSSISLVKSGLEEQIALLEKQVKAEESRNANLQEQLTSTRENSNSSQRQTEELNIQMCDLKRELQHAKSIGEQQALEMSTLTSEFSRKEMDLQIKIHSFSSHIQSLETSLATIKQELLTSNSEKEHLREEFESYRLRAQSTLARQKGDSVSQGEKEAREQLDKLKKELDGAREKMENNQTEIETMNNKLLSLQMEKARSDKRYEDMTKALHQKITDYDTLNTEYRAFKFSAETLLHNTKIEFEERERSLKEEIATLKGLVNSLNEKFSLEMKEVCQEQDTKNSIIGSNLFEALQHHENLPSLQEREDGEGSESVPPPMGNFCRLSNLVPLDILLNNPIDDENRIPVLQEQIEKLHSELNSYEVRVKHLASLLSEAEKDSARSSQQNAVLKEELRRLERSLQREPHIANSEYLKNVIFKFLVLQNGDERTRLVPVLDTILKLSPEETNRLTAVAKGESTSSWGSYLHSWTGL